MGVDVNGIEPMNASGEWIGYNNLIWGALWDLCVDITPLLRQSDRDLVCGGGKSFVIRGDEHEQLKQRLKKVLREPNTNHHFIKYVGYLKKHDEHGVALKIVREFNKFINNNIGFVVS